MIKHICAVILSCLGASQVFAAQAEDLPYCERSSSADFFSNMLFGSQDWGYKAYKRSYSVEKIVGFRPAENWRDKLGFYKPSPFGGNGTVEISGETTVSLKSDGTVFLRTSYPIMIGEPSAPLVDVAKAQNVKLMFGYRLLSAETFTPLAYAGSSVSDLNGQLHADLKDEPAKLLREAIASGENVSIGLFAGQNLMARSDAINNEGYDKGLADAKAAFDAIQVDSLEGRCQ